MAGYIPLFSSLISSSVWNEDSDTCKVWITLMAMSDKDGLVEGSIVGIAPIARISAEACATAIKILEAPDPNSRSPEYEGRRLLPVPGGWKLVNHKKYRDLARSRAAYYQNWRQQRKKERSKEIKETNSEADSDSATHANNAQHSATHTQQTSNNNQKPPSPSFQDIAEIKRKEASFAKCCTLCGASSKQDSGNMVWRENMPFCALYHYEQWVKEGKPQNE